MDRPCAPRPPGEFSCDEDTLVDTVYEPECEYECVIETGVLLLFEACLDRDDAPSSCWPLFAPLFADAAKSVSSVRADLLRPNLRETLKEEPDPEACSWIAPLLPPFRRKMFLHEGDVGADNADSDGPLATALRGRRKPEWEDDEDAEGDPSEAFVLSTSR